MTMILIVFAVFTRSTENILYLLALVLQDLMRQTYLRLFDQFPSSFAIFKISFHLRRVLSDLQQFLGIADLKYFQ